MLIIAAVGQSLMPFVVLAAHRWRSHPPAEPRRAERALPYPKLDLPPEINGSQYFPVAWSDIPGWNDDDQLAAYQTFRASCKSIAAQPVDAPQDSRALSATLREPCRAARATEISDGANARTFFEQNFVPLEISRLGQDAGFVTGYYEPIIEGSRTENEVYNVPVYRRPSNLFMRGYSQASPDLPNKGPVFRKIGRRKLVPYYDRGEIEDGVLDGRGIEIVWLRDQTDLLFAQIQGSARVLLPDGSTVRINYNSYNGYPFTAVGRILVERGIYTREEISMQKIREWMEAHPDGAKELRRQNRSYVFFREVQLWRQGRGDRRPRHSADAGPLDRGRQGAACLWHAVLHRRRTADRVGEVEDAVPPADDRAGHGFGHRRPRARRPLFRSRPGGRQGRRPAQEQHALRDAGAEEPRSRRAWQATAAARCTAVGADRKAVPADGTCSSRCPCPGEGSAEGPEDRIFGLRLRPPGRPGQPRCRCPSSVRKARRPPEVHHSREPRHIRHP